MGMYGRIMLDITCPFCKETKRMEVQSKELECGEPYEKGDLINEGTHDLNILDYCCTVCTPCKNSQNNYDNGSFFELDIELDEGIVTGNYKTKNINQ